MGESTPGRSGRAARRRTARNRRGLFVLVGILMATGIGVAVYRATQANGTAAISPSPHHRKHHVSPGALPPSGPAATSSPAAGASASPTTPAYAPADIAPVVHPAAKGEGVWHPAQPWVLGGSPVQLAWYRPSAANPSVRAYVAWIDSTRTATALYPGTENPPPPPNLPRGPMMIPTGARPRLLAAFNGGFFLQGPPGFQNGLTTRGGFVVGSHVYKPLVDGLATAIAYNDGTVTLTKWTGGPTPPSNAVWVRQNFPLMVANGKVNPTVSNNNAWGVTLGGVPAIWRTAMCIDPHGNLMYVAAGAQTAASLAQILVHVGCVNAMQLDINPEWPIFNVYGAPNAQQPRQFVPNPNQSIYRYLYPGTNKDFFGVYLRTTPRYWHEPGF